MINKIISAIKDKVFRDTDVLHSKVNDFELYKSQVDDLHNHYATYIEPLKDNIVKSVQEDAHFAELNALYSTYKILSCDLSKAIAERVETLRDAEKKFKFESKISKSLNKKRHEMPQVDPDNVTEFIKHFDDKVGVSSVKRKLNQLKPSQNEFDKDKILHFISEYENSDKQPKKVKYIISDDNYLLDGHHRWAAALELQNENSPVECYKINLPADDLIKQSNKLKMTKNVDIDDKTFKKAIVTIALAKTQGFLNNEILDIIKAKTAILVPVNKTVIRDGKAFNQIFWVAPNKVSKYRGRTIRKQPEDVDNTDIRTVNEALDPARYKIQVEDDSITNVGDFVDVKYIGKTSKAKFEFEGLRVVKVTENSISVEIPRLTSTNATYKNGADVVFRKGAVITIPKYNNKHWNLDNNYKLKLSQEDRDNRLKGLTFLTHMQDFARKAQRKGYDVYSDALTMTEEQIKAKYSPYFAKYGKTFNPIQMFDECKEAILKHFGEDTFVEAYWNQNNFGIDAYKNGSKVLHTHRTFASGDYNLPPMCKKLVSHSYFAISKKKYWGGGLGKELFCAYYEQYKKMGIDGLIVHPGLESGPYVWPSYAFYSPVQLATHLLDYFKAGQSREVKTHYVEMEPDVEYAKIEDSKIWIKYKDAEFPIDVTNEKDYSPEDRETITKIDGEIEELKKQKEQLELGVGDIVSQEVTDQISHIDRKLVYKEQEKRAITKVQRYKRGSDGDIIDITKCRQHTISAEEEAEALRVFNKWKAANPNATLFKSTIWTKNPMLRDASKVAYLNGDRSYDWGHHVVNMNNPSHRQDFEDSIKYDKYLKKKNARASQQPVSARA